MADHFPDPLRGEFLDHGRRLRLTHPLTFIDGEIVLAVPAGFVTDFNSVPRPLWVWFPPWEFPHAGVVHDWLYQFPGEWSRLTCDLMHRRILEIEGCRASKRLLAFYGIRAGGWAPWNRYRQGEIA
jgi:hypothetical protein